MSREGMAFGARDFREWWAWWDWNGIEKTTWRRSLPEYDWDWESGKTVFAPCHNNYLQQQVHRRWRQQSKNKRVDCVVTALSSSPLPFALLPPLFPMFVASRQYFQHLTARPTPLRPLPTQDTPRTLPHVLFPSLYPPIAFSPDLIGASLPSYISRGPSSSPLFL